MTDRYARYEELRELALKVGHAGEWDLSAALEELARLVLLEREQHAAAALRQLALRS